MHSTTSPTPDTLNKATPNGNAYLTTDAIPQALSDNASPRLLIEQGVVQSLDGGFAYILAQRASGCGGCPSSGSCGTSALAKLFTSHTQSAIKVNNSLQCQVGDTVVLTLDESRLLKHSFMAYGLPLVGLFFLAWASAQITQSLGGSEGLMDVASIIGGLLGLLVGWGVTRWFYQPVMPELHSVLVRASDTIENRDL